MAFRSALLNLLVFALISSTAYGAYDQSVTWSDMSNLDLRPVLKSQYASENNLLDPNIPDSATELVLNDADHHIINEGFRIPPELRESVAFWLKIYTQYTTQHLVLYDSNHPGRVYEVLDFRELAKTSRSQIVYEILRKQRTEKTLAAYRAAFKHLAKNPHPKHPSREELNIIGTIPNVSHKRNFAELNKHLRTQTGQRDNIIKGLVAGETYFPKMEGLFLKMGLPVELTRISLVESSFDLDSRSRTGAAGVWQFMPNSGKEFLLIDDRHQIDERISPLKATVAAGKLLKRNHAILKDWALAVTSYNHGLRGLLHVKASPGRKNVWKMLDSDSSHLGIASRNYYSEFLAVLHAEAYRKIYYGEPPVVSDHVKFTQFVQIPKAMLASTFSKENGISLQEFRVLNPDIRNISRLIPAGFWIALPAHNDDLTGLTPQRHPPISRKSASISRASTRKKAST
jgi:membrane-bound lytic murein transglycosylase D